MSNKTTLRALCVKRIAPIAAALAFTLSSTPAEATILDAQRELSSKLTLVNSKAPTILKATATDLVAAVGLLIEDINDGTPVANVTVEEAVAAAIADVGGKVRGDRDKVAPQLITTAALVGGLDNAGFASLVGRVFGVNVGKLQLTVKGKASAVYAALQAVTSKPASWSTNIGTAVAPNILTDADLQAFLAATSAALGKNTLTVGEQLEDFVGGVLVQKGKAGTAGEALIKTAAEKVAAANPEAAGAYYGGLVASSSTAYDEAAERDTLAKATVVGVNQSKKLAKAKGSILANIFANAPAAELVALAGNGIYVGGVPKTATTDALVVQGILRADAANALVEADINTILGKVIVASTASAKAKFAGTVALGNDGTKLTLIIKKVVDGISASKDLATIGAAAINSVGVADPEAAGFVASALLPKVGNASAGELGALIVAKLKTYAAAGYMAKALVVDSGANATSAASIAASIMLKGSKAANDVALRISQAPVIGEANAVAFAEGIVNAPSGTKLVQSAAVGTSIAHPIKAGDITAAAIVHGNGSDKAALGKAATIAGAVALAANVETASIVALAVGGKMAAVNSPAKPIKLSLVTAMATALGKSINAKPGVDTKNRMDEFGELAAVIARIIVQSDATDAVEAKLLAAAGGAVIKQLAKTNQPGIESKGVFLKADLAEVDDLAGSFALAIKDVLGAAANTTYLAAGGALEKALQKAAGKLGSAAVATAFGKVRGATGKDDPTVAGYEFTAVPELVAGQETDTRDF